uniref:Uncharacterized protein n=1 Tax=Candidatus Kentrum sp. DK TaxID=2126562 RepID=A0A450SLF7_9GAMM|nr:MAG: hypothetical protein BECKDK2373C_GA0170839_104330 [Candidatus Kentron sp. DK]VFJ67259.1 MAG: hypothetical protein BECKDK2373B_GA0170837_11887 [Candidatus Kentron sp. DK]
MSQFDTSITHITEAGANVFEDLGFDKIEAEKLKRKAELMCASRKNKNSEEPGHIPKPVPCQPSASFLLLSGTGT